MKSIVISSDDLPPRLREILDNKMILVYPYVRCGLVLAPWRDTHLPWYGKYADHPVISVEHFLKFTREER
jgi:hypothetical protein